MTIAKIIEFGRKAEGTKVGYDQSQRWSFLDKKNKKLLTSKETDCSALTAGIFYLAGYPINITGTCWTGNLATLAKQAGARVLKYTRKEDVIAGDGVVKAGSHAILALSKTEWLTADKDERGRASGGQAGDQTGREVYIRKPYERSGGWDYIIRFPADPKPIAEPPASTNKITAAHIAAALKRVGSSTTRSQVRVRRDKTTVATSLTQLADQLNKDLSGRKLNKYAVASFMATMLQESDWLRTTVEYSQENLRYDPYRGRTFEQVTHKDNYAAFGKWAKSKGYISDENLFVNNPEQLGDLKWAWLGGVWYFDHRKIWDESTNGDFQRVSTTVNLGSPSTTRVPSGWSTRLNAYKAFLQAYSKSPTLSITKTMNKETVRRMQEHIGAEVDGVIGPQTWYLFGLWVGLSGKFDINNKTHVKRFQKKIGLSTANQDGTWWMPKSQKWGPVTTSTFQSYLNDQR